MFKTLKQKVWFALGCVLMVLAAGKAVESATATEAGQLDFWKPFGLIYFTVMLWSFAGALTPIMQKMFKGVGGSAVAERRRSSTQRGQ